MATGRENSQRVLTVLAALGLAARLVTCALDRQESPGARIPIVQPRDDAAESKTTLRVARVRVEPDPLVFDGRDRHIRGKAIVTFNEPAAEPGTVEVAAVFPRDPTRLIFPAILGRQKFEIRQGEVQVELDGRADAAGEIEVRTLIVGQPVAFTHWMNGRSLDTSLAAGVLLPPGVAAQIPRAAPEPPSPPPVPAPSPSVAPRGPKAALGPLRPIPAGAPVPLEIVEVRLDPDSVVARPDPDSGEAYVSVTFSSAAKRAGTAVASTGEPGGSRSSRLGSQTFAAGESSVRVKIKFRPTLSGNLPVQVRLTGQGDQAIFNTTVSLRKK